MKILLVLLVNHVVRAARPRFDLVLSIQQLA